MTARILLSTLGALALLGGCASGGGGGGYGGFGLHRYTLIEPGQEDVARTMLVTPTIRWNRAPRLPTDISREENWTLNGPMLDSLAFIGGLENGKPLVRWQRRSDIRQVPNFRADMTPPEIASMIESFYRIRAGSVSFEMTGLQPRAFLGHPGFQFDYDHLGGNELARRGRVVGAVINDRLYMILFDAAKMHYFPTIIPEVERIIDSARLRSQR
ncbi:hypothetical protein [Allosphingosinicella sp.]|jgi:hypothetical protein|uniref:hypothetical protein n=1 Tax=Allosphingosinicella sp. TaxID=2823234 RepID=UPI002F0C8A6B